MSTAVSTTLRRWSTLDGISLERGRIGSVVVLLSGVALATSGVTGIAAGVAVIGVGLVTASLTAFATVQLALLTVGPLSPTLQAVLHAAAAVILFEPGFQSMIARPTLSIGVVTGAVLITLAGILWLVAAPWVAAGVFGLSVALALYTIHRVERVTLGVVES